MSVIELLVERVLPIGKWLLVGLNNTAHDMDYLYNKVNVEVFKEWLLMF